MFNGKQKGRQRLHSAHCLTARKYSCARRSNSSSAASSSSVLLLPSSSSLEEPAEEADGASEPEADDDDDLFFFLLLFFRFFFLCVFFFCFLRRFLSFRCLVHGYHVIYTYEVVPRVEHTLGARASLFSKL